MDLRLLDQVRRVGGLAFAEAVVLGGTGNQGAAEVAYDIAWEQLHSGSWDSVATVWRDAYALSCLHMASCLRSSAPVAEALKYLDLGLIMGGTLFREQLNAAISGIQSEPGVAGKKVQPLQDECAEGNLHESKAVGVAIKDDEEGAIEEAYSTVIYASESDHERGSDSVSVKKLNLPSPPCDEGSQKNWRLADLRIQLREGCGDTKNSSELLRSLPHGSLQGGTIEVKLLPSIECFLCDHFLPGIPVIIKGAITHWPAMKKWRNLNYLLKVAGSRTVPVEVGRHYLAQEWNQKLMTISELIMCWQESEHSNSCAYLAQHPLFEQIPELREDIAVPDYCSLGGGTLKSINAWFGPRGTITPLHYDPVHNVFAQVVGLKYIRLYPASVSSELYPFSDQMLQNSSQVDLDHADDQKFPLARDLHFVDCILEPGDVLYVPPKWWHYVRALSTSFSVSFWWDVDEVTDNE